MAEAGKSSPWIWISLGLIIGLFVAFVFFLDQKIVKTAHQPVPADTTREDSKKPIFDFYTVLPQREVDIPEPDLSENTPNAQSPQSPQTQHSAKVKYLLQAGSFTNAEDAERQKAQLALVGLQSVVSKANVNGAVYFRVELGPFADNGTFSEAKNLLIENDIPYIPKTIH